MRKERNKLINLRKMQNKPKEVISSLKKMTMMSMKMKSLRRNLKVWLTSKSSNNNKRLELILTIRIAIRYLQ